METHISPISVGIITQIPIFSMGKSLTRSFSQIFSADHCFRSQTVAKQHVHLFIPIQQCQIFQSSSMISSGCEILILQIDVINLFLVVFILQRFTIIILVMKCGFNILNQSKQKWTANWCKFLAVDPYSFGIQCSQLFIETLLIVVFIFYIHKRKQHLKQIPLSKNETNINNLIFLWCTFSIYRSIIGIGIYLFGKQLLSIDKFLYASAYFNYLKAFIVFFLHSLLFKIPCVWLENTLNTIDSQLVTLRLSKQLNRTYTVIKCFSVFYNFRFFLLIGFLCCQLTMVYCPQVGETTDLIQSIVVSAQACIILSVYTYSFVIIVKFRGLIKMQSGLIQQLLMEYMMLVICCTSRVVFNILLFSLTPSQSDKISVDETCKRTEWDQRYLWAIYKFLVYYLSHYLPIATILKLYWPNRQNMEKRNSWNDSDLEKYLIESGLLEKS